MSIAKTITKEEKEKCRIITPIFRVSYPHVFKPQAPKKGDKLKFSITMLYSKDSDLTGSSPDGKPRTLQEVIKNAKLAAFGEKKNWPKGLVSPVNDGDDPKYSDKEGYKGHYVIKAVSAEDQRPSVVDRDMNPLTEPADLYPGCFARAYVYAYVWSFMNKSGVGFILDHVQKIKDGKSFGGKKPVEQVFKSVSLPDDEETVTKESEDFF